MKERVEFTPGQVDYLTQVIPNHPQRKATPGNKRDQSSIKLNKMIHSLNKEKYNTPVNVNVKLNLIHYNFHIHK